MRCPSFQSVGTYSSSQIFPNRVFSVSVDILSDPTVLPLLICLMDILICSAVGRLTSIGRSVCASLMSVVFIGAGLFRSSSNYSSHLSRCC
ncbi:unnamed protein product [Schistosoma curassoni]|uniref:SSD domain-containing protein n=1 Tax=Schistosoma curassoni TaxID=6186 RepID=A0A183KMK0_9TREM|nr:unnamed protein product [Schistosoma curassoni]